MNRGTYTNHPKQKRLEALENTHKQAYNRVLPLINYPCLRSEGSYERMFQSSGRETRLKRKGNYEYESQMIEKQAFEFALHGKCNPVAKEG